MGAWAASRKSTYLQIRQYGQLWAESLLSQHSLTLYYVAKLRWAMVQLLIRSSCVCLSRPVIRTLRPVRRIYLRANGEWSAFCANLPRDQVAFPVNRTRPLLLESETFSLSRRRSSGPTSTHRTHAAACQKVCPCAGPHSARSAAGRRGRRLARSWPLGIRRAAWW